MVANSGIPRNSASRTRGRSVPGLSAQSCSARPVAGAETRPRRAHGRPRHAGRGRLTWGFAAAYAGAFAGASRSASYSGVGAFVVVPTIGLLGLAAAVALAQRETDRILRRIIVGAFALKLAAALVMYGITFGIYGSGDVQLYHTSGEVVAAGIWDGEFRRGLGRFTGTGFLSCSPGWCTP